MQLLLTYTLNPDFEFSNIQSFFSRLTLIHFPKKLILKNSVRKSGNIYLRGSTFAYVFFTPDLSSLTLKNIILTLKDDLIMA